jgi:hypothetical protein
MPVIERVVNEEIMKETHVGRRLNQSKATRKAKGKRGQMLFGSAEPRAFSLASHFNPSGTCCERELGVKSVGV